jgi:uncharacterized membrane protein HdeD (DUF308 family)
LPYERRLRQINDARSAFLGASAALFVIHKPILRTFLSALLLASFFLRAGVVQTGDFKETSQKEL